MKKIRFLSPLFFLGALALGVSLLVGCDGECLHLRPSEQTFPPDCDSVGYTLVSCEKCGERWKTEIVSPTGHSMSATVTDPTCTAEGYTTHTCGKCDFSYISDPTPPRGHDTVAIVTDPTCNTEGYTTHACRNCDYSYRSEIVPPTGHAFTPFVTAATCTEVGYTDYVCDRCRLCYTGNWMVPTGHDFKVEEVNPTTCTDTGYTTYTCRICDFRYTGDFRFYSDIFGGAHDGAEAEPIAHGVDISRWNHDTSGGVYLPIDFEAIAAAGFDFVILKIGSTPRINAKGEPAGGMEPMFEENYAAARAAGLDIGVYFYTYSTTVDDTRADAALVMSWLEGKTLEYPVYFDLEDESVLTDDRREMTDLCLAFISTLQENRYFGALYTNNNWLTKQLQTDKVTFLFDIWYARPLTSPPYVWNEEKYDMPPVGMWQYTWTGTIPGASSKEFDLNFAYKDYPTLIRALGYNGYSAE